ncbi:hypothetical protein CC78DRAFT_144133 [Lojkania enalia]|uniref:Uncharacterized protein n=1 Tax=Lojkania enalia TaxID=147567 RepID=A0A9P4MXE6_9PLEO|nr:hypothetical protein CC78DRAFT_144133 [Didymosphaeria enalia]
MEDPVDGANAAQNTAQQFPPDQLEVHRIVTEYADNSALEPSSFNSSANLLDSYDKFDQATRHLGGLTHRFLESLKQRFGANSQQYTASIDILGDFRAGKVPKVDAYLTILAQLGGHGDLKQDLCAVFFHEDARWESQDFRGQGPPATNAQSLISPGYLQPQHQPQLPSTSAFWGPTPQAAPTQPATLSINSFLLQDPSQIVSRPQNSTHAATGHHPFQSTVNYGYGDQNFTQGSQMQNFSMPSGPLFQLPSSPPLQFSNPFACYGQSTSPLLARTRTRTASLHPFNGYGYGSPMSSPVQETHPYDQMPRSLSLNDVWNTDRTRHDAVSWNNDRDKANGELGHLEQNVSFLHTEPTPQLESTCYSSLDAAPSVLGAPFTVPLGQPTAEMPTPKKQPTNQLFTLIDPRPDGPFIHSICGKGFATRSGVKKHHWGSSTQNPETKKGCWVKNGKPGVAWDAHPSCQGSRHVPEKRRKGNEYLGQSTRKLNELDFLAPAAPSMIPTVEASTARNTLPGFPTLSELPSKVAESLSSTSPPLFPVIVEAPPLQTSKLPGPTDREDFEKLLTVANFAASIDAPLPQAYNDSVVSHLDTQASLTTSQLSIAAENGVTQSGRQMGPSSLDNTSFSRVYNNDVPLSPLPTVRLGMTQANQLARAQNLSDVPSHLAIPSYSRKTKDENTVADLNGGAMKNRKRRSDSSENSAISKQELKSLGVDTSPRSEKKRQKSESETKEAAPDVEVAEVAGPSYVFH